MGSEYVSEEVSSRESSSVPLSRREIWAGLYAPHTSVRWILGEKERLAGNVVSGENLGTVVTWLLLVSLLSTVPYALFSPVERAGDVAVLYVGSLFICFPSLHIFSQFLGCRMGLLRLWALALCQTSTAGLFTFGFFPIIWFIDYSIDVTPTSLVQPSVLSVLLLMLALFLGMVQLIRMLFHCENKLSGGRRAIGLLPLWFILLIFISWRMANVLGLV